MNEIKWIPDHLAQHNPGYVRYERYYAGQHTSILDEVKVREKLGRAVLDLVRNCRDNLCAGVCDTLSDRLQLSGFTSETNQDLVDEIWTVNRLELRSDEAHDLAVRLGDVYISVWPDATGTPRIYLEDPRTIAPRYDARGEQIIEAAKVIAGERNTQITIYTPDAITTYSTKDGRQSVPESLSDLILQDQQPNPYGQVPIWRMGSGSELSDIIPLQDLLNKLLVDMVVGAEYQSLPQRWITGVQPRLDANGNPVPIPDEGPGSIIQITPKDAKVGEFSAANLTQFLEVHDSIRQEIARVSRTPAHLLLSNSGDYPSGKALETAEAPLMARVRDRQLAWGATWTDAMTFACRIAGTDVTDVTPNWVDTSPQADPMEQAELALKLLEAGVPRDYVMQQILQIDPGT